MSSFPCWCWHRIAVGRESAAGRWAPTNSAAGSQVVDSQPVPAAAQSPLALFVESEKDTYKG